MFKTQNTNFKNNPKKIKKLYIIYGGPSSEREVSFASKDYFCELFKDKNPILVEWLNDFKFQILPPRHSGLPESRQAGEPESKVEILKQVQDDASHVHLYSEEDFYQKLSKEKCLVIIAGHGEYIEDGYLQERLSLHKIPFTGSCSSSCKLAMNKYESQLVAEKFVKTIPTYKCKPKDFNFTVFEKYVGTFPVFAKPNNLGSSVGCVKAKSKTELKKVLLSLDDIDYLFQPEIKGVELSVGTVRKGSNYLNLPVTEIRPTVSDFFSWDAKYKKGGSNEITPATVSSEVQIKIKELANKIHNALGLGFYSRSDFILSRKNLYYLETNPYPGMSSASLLPQQLVVSKSVEIFKRGLLQNFVNPISKTAIKLKIPYQSQFTLSKNNNVARDNGWEVPVEGYNQSGAKSISDYKKYSNNICGTACIKMILDYYDKHPKSLFEVFYLLNDLDLYTEDLSLNYADLSNFSKSYNLKSKTYRSELTIDEVCRSLCKGIPVVLSVGTFNIKPKEQQKTSGHLVLCVGYNLNKKVLYIHDPSGDCKNNNCEYRSVDFSEFYNVCSGKGFIVYK